MNKQFGKYEVLSRLGTGGMGIVYLARDTLLGRQVALKVLDRQHQGDEDAARRFLHEARISAGLSHPNIVVIYDFGTQGATSFIAMEHLAGENLRALIAKRAQLSLARKLVIALQIAKALEHAHSCSVVHRDVKPSNIQILPSGDVKLMDFGIAKLATAEMTRSGVTVGTPHYSSPEQVRSQPVTPASDVFSFGLVLYELLTYRKAFTGEDFAALVYRIAYDEPAPFEPQDEIIPAAVKNLLHRCLAKRPTDRYESFTPVLHQLRVVLRDLSATRSRAKAPLPTEIFWSEEEESTVKAMLAGYVELEEDPTLGLPQEDQQVDPVRAGRRQAEPRDRSPTGQTPKEHPPTPPIAGREPRHSAGMPAAELTEDPGDESGSAEIPAGLAAGERSLAATLLLGVAGAGAVLGLALALVLWPSAEKPALEETATAQAPDFVAVQRPARSRAPRQQSDPAPPVVVLPTASPEPARPRMHSPTPDWSAELLAEVLTPAAAPRPSERRPAFPPATPASSPLPTPREAGQARPEAQPPPAMRMAASLATSVALAVRSLPATPAPTDSPARMAASLATSVALAVRSMPATPAPSDSPSPISGPRDLQLTPTPELAPPPSAEDVRRERRAIRETLRQYIIALERRELSGIRRLWPDLGPERIERLEADFASMESQKVEIRVLRFAFLPRLPSQSERIRIEGRLRRSIRPKGGDLQIDEGPVILQLRRSSGRTWIIEDVR